MVLTELLRLSDCLAIWSFCWSNILRVQPKSNWTVGKRLLSSGCKTVWNSKLILSKARLNVFNGWFANCIISKELALKEAIDDVNRSRIPFPTDHFVDRTFRGSNWSLTEQLVKGWQPFMKEQLHNTG